MITQGKWTVFNGEDDYTIDSGFVLIARVPNTTRNAQANAKLMAAAPELLDVLKNALVTFSIMAMPITGNPKNVASNYDLLKIVADSFKQAITSVE